MNILIVENDLYMLNHLRKIIYEVSSLIKNIDISQDFDSAFSKCFSNVYDLILLDIFLDNGEKTGLDLCKSIRSNNAETPIIIISAHNSIKYIEKAFTLGVNDYILKPFHSKELQFRIKQWLFAQYNISINNSIVYYDLSYNIDKNEFYYKCKLLNLTKRNKQLLIMFLKFPEKLLSATYLKEKLWGDYYDLGKNRNLRSNIQILRESLGDVCDITIDTVRGEGYLLNKSDKEL